MHVYLVLILFVVVGLVPTVYTILLIGGDVQKVWLPFVSTIASSGQHGFDTESTQGWVGVGGSIAQTGRPILVVAHTRASAANAVYLHFLIMHLLVELPIVWRGRERDRYYYKVSNVSSLNSLSEWSTAWKPDVVPNHPNQIRGIESQRRDYTNHWEDIYAVPLISIKLFPYLFSSLSITIFMHNMSKSKNNIFSRFWPQVFRLCSHWNRLIFLSFNNSIPSFFQYSLNSSFSPLLRGLPYSLF